MGRPGQTFRYIKWVGDPAMLKSDGFSVHNWRYQNKRSYPMTMPSTHTGRVRRVIEPGTYTSRDGTMTCTIKHTYVWDQDNCQDWTIPVELSDAMAILAFYPYAFKDVTGVKEWGEVRNAPIIVPDRPRQRARA